jgi:hypothetical protein
MSQLRMVLDSLKTENISLNTFLALNYVDKFLFFVAAESTAIRKTCHLRIVFPLIQDSLNINSTV